MRAKEAGHSDSDQVLRIALRALRGQGGTPECEDACRLLVAALTRD